MGWIDHQRVKLQRVGIAAYAADPAENLSPLDGGDSEAVGVDEKGMNFFLCFARGLVRWAMDGLSQDPGGVGQLLDG